MGQKHSGYIIKIGQYIIDSMNLFSYLIFSCSIPQSLMELEYSYYSTCNHLPDVDKEVTGVYSFISGSEGNSVEQPEYLNITKPKKQQLSPEEMKIQPQPTNGAESVSACLDQESQKMSPSEEYDPIYTEPDLSKKWKSHSSLLSTTESTNDSPPPIPPKAKVL